MRPNYKYETDRMDLDAHMYKGGAIDIHKAIGKIPKPKAGWTSGKYKYMGPHNPLDKQLEYVKNTGRVQPYNKVDEIQYGEMPKWGSTARFLIDKKQRLGLGVSKNGKSRRVK